MMSPEFLHMTYLANSVWCHRESSSIDVAAVADVDDEHEQFPLTDEVDDAVAPHPIGVPALQFALERLALIRITLKIIEDTGDPLIKRRFSLSHTTDDVLGLVGEFKLIDGQGRL